MKKSIFLIIFCLSAGLISAQNFIDKHYSHLEEMEASTVIHVAKMSFQIASTVIPDREEDERKIKNLVSSIESFDLVQVPDMPKAKEVYNNALRKLESQFEELMNIKEDGKLFSLHINENGGIIYELVGLGHETEEFTVFSVVGEIALEDIGQILSKIRNNDAAVLDKVRNLDPSDLSVYPNPVNVDADITIEVPDSMVGADASLLDMNGTVIQRFKVNATSQSLNVKSIQPGYFIVNVEKDGVTMKKKILAVQ